MKHKENEVWNFIGPWQTEKDFLFVAAVVEELHRVSYQMPRPMFWFLTDLSDQRYFTPSVERHYQLKGLINLVEWKQKPFYDSGPITKEEMAEMIRSFYSNYKDSYKEHIDSLRDGEAPQIDPEQIELPILDA